jgi:hypothetical protein
MNPSTKRNARGNGRNPKIPAKGVKGRPRVITTRSKVAITRYRPGLLWNKGILVRMTSTIIDAEITDSTNQAVLNYHKNIC